MYMGLKALQELATLLSVTNQVLSEPINLLLRWGDFGSRRRRRRRRRSGFICD
jgi:hypothetical protein